MTFLPKSLRVMSFTALTVFLAGQSATTLWAQNPPGATVQPATPAPPSATGVLAQAATNPQAGMPPPPAPNVASAAADPASERRTVTLNLRQLGAWSAIRLNGGDNIRSLLFSVRPDQQVVSAVLKLRYDYSPALLADLSHLVIGLNNENVALLALPTGSSLGNEREIALDPSLFRARNNDLNLRFIGHYTRQCEDPFHSSLWLSISERTQLQLTLAPVRPNTIDLSRVQDLFVQPDATDPQVVPIVFAKNASFGSYKAAGIVASWLGAQSRTRNLRFAVQTDALPRSNAIVVMAGDSTLSGVQSAQVATLSIQPNPVSPNDRLLVISGSDEAALQRAALALALTQRSLTGNNVEIRRDVIIPVRKPYDAPAWLPLDRPVRFGEISGPAELNVRGYFPGTIRLNYRVPPDLFTWRTPGAPMLLRYHATSLPSQWNSTLNVTLNREQLQSIAINSGRIEQFAQASRTDTPARDDKAGPQPAVQAVLDSPLRTSNLHLPAHAITGRDQLQLQFAFDMLRRGICQDVPVDNMIGTINAESTVDFSKFPHYAAMPNLEFFSSLGFPFTRMADLAETAVVMPDRPALPELGLYLSAMALMGESTGYPVTRHELATAAALDRVADRDLLVIGTGQAQGLLAKWAEHLPIADFNGERRLRDTVKSWRPTYRWENRDIDPLSEPQGDILLAAPGQLSALMGFQSPLTSGRSVVFLYADQAAGLDRLATALTDASRWREIKGDFSMVDDRFIETAKVTPTYYVGALPVKNKLLWFLRDQPLIVALAGVLGILLLAAVLYRRLRQRR